MSKKIAVIGAGAAGSSIIKALRNGGNDVTVGLRSPEKFDGAVAIADAIKAGDIVVLALPYAAGFQVAADNAADLKGKIVIDMMNPLKSDLSGYDTFAGKSGAEHLQDALPDSKVVETFNHVDAPVLANPQGALQFVLGNDRAAVNEVAEIAKQAGFDAQPINDLSKTEQVEGFAFMWIFFTVVLKKNPNLKLNLQ